MNNDINIASRAQLYYRLQQSYKTFKKEVAEYASFHNEIPEELAAKHDKMIAKQFLYGVFAAMETLFSDSALNLLVSYPAKISKQKTDTELLTSISTISSAIRHHAQKHVNDLAYMRPVAYISQVYSLFGEKMELTDAKLGIIIEAKATRDIYMHNNGKSNFLYRDKAGKYARESADDKELKLDYLYIKNLTEALEELGANFNDNCIQKHKDDITIKIFRKMWEMSALERLVPFSNQWDDTGDMVTIKDYQWRWSHSEQGLFNFFRFIHGGPNKEDLGIGDIPRALQRWRGSLDERLIQSWLEDPFHL